MPKKKDSNPQTTKDFLEKLEFYETIAQDAKKVFIYDKVTTKWVWCHRGYSDDPDNWSKPFKTRFKALLAAIEPYLKTGGI